MSEGRRSRLSDTRALAQRPLKDSSACPDAGGAITARRAIPGVLAFSYGAEGLDLAPKAEPSVGPEGLRSAVMIANGGRVR